MLSGLEELILFGFVPLMIGVFAWPAGTREQSVAGRIVIPPYRALPEGATVTIELIEYGRGETFHPVLSRETIRWRGPETQKFTLHVDLNLIHPMACYALQARIVAEGKVRFETQYGLPVAPLGGDQVTLTLVQAAA